MRRGRAAVGLLALGLVLAACGDGEDRPGEVTSEDGGTGTATGTGSGTHSGSASGTGAHGEGEKEEDSAPAFPADEATASVDVRLEEFRFEGIPATIQGPNVLFRATNYGDVQHELEVVDSGGEAVGVVVVDPGSTKVLAVELEPGDYRAECHLETGGQVHADLGMTASFTVT